MVHGRGRPACRCSSNGCGTRCSTSSAPAAICRLRRLSFWLTHWIVRSTPALIGGYCGTRPGTSNARLERANAARRLERLTRVRAFLHEHAWFLTFWSIVAALCVVEALWPALSSNPDRTRSWSINFRLGVFNGLIL